MASYAGPKLQILSRQKDKYLPFRDLASMLQLGWITTYNVEQNLQHNIRPGNTILTMKDRICRTYYSVINFDRNTNQIFLPQVIY